MNSEVKTGGGDIFLGYHLRVMEEKLDSALAKTNTVFMQGAHIMATVVELKTNLEAIRASVSGVSGDVADLAKQILDLKNQQTPVTQEQLDELVTDSADIAQRLSALDAQNPVPPAA